MKNLLLPLLISIAPAAVSAEETLTQCRQIEGIAERVACYDAIVDAQYPMDSRRDAESVPAPDVAISPAAPDAQSLFGTDDAEAKRIVETTLAIAQIDHIEALVTEVRRSATRKLTVALDNGQVWRQLDNKSMRLKTGERVTVSRASLGSFLMEKESGGRRIRVKRVN